jgi:H+/Cl- antiporter ClcA
MIAAAAGTYALIGAAAVLGGATRMTVSLAVILLETTGNYQVSRGILVSIRFIAAS